MSRKNRILFYLMLDYRQENLKIYSEDKSSQYTSIGLGMNYYLHSYSSMCSSSTSLRFVQLLSNESLGYYEK